MLDALGRRRRPAASGADGGAYRRADGAARRRRRRRCSTTCSAPLRVPRHPAASWRASACSGVRSATRARAARFRGERARALFAGFAAHSMLPLTSRRRARRSGSMLGAAGHAVGWPSPAAARSGSPTPWPSISARSAARSRPAGAVDVARRARRRGAVLLDVTPRQLLASPATAAGRATAAGSSRFRYGPGVFKLDWALDGPIPWRRRSAGARGDGPPRRHARRDRRVARRRSRAASTPSGRSCCSPQQSLFDPTRAPAGQAHRLGLLPRPARLDAST